MYQMNQKNRSLKAILIDLHTTSYITEYIGGTLHGESDLEIVGVCSLNNSKVGYITFYNNSSNLKDLISSKASVIIIDNTVIYS